MLPTAATIMGLIVLWYSVYPVPAAPIGYAVIIGLAWLAVGFAVTWYYVKRHPQLMNKAGLSRE